jgi:Family of unknown function (DUF5675)
MPARESQAMNLELIRVAYLPTATLGLLRVGTERFETIERPWVPDPDGPGGEAQQSSIPDGRFVLRPWDSPKFGPVYLFEAPALGVYATEKPVGAKYGRTHVLLHAANQVSELLGCVAPGMRAGIQDGKHWVYESRRALARVSELLGRVDEHSVTIRATRGTEEPE